VGGTKRVRRGGFLQLLLGRHHTPKSQVSQLSFEGCHKHSRSRWVCKVRDRAERAPGRRPCLCETG
jgi:hypothetical protein